VCYLSCEALGGAGQIVTAVPIKTIAHATLIKAG
jgi:hypothetical protein